MIGNFKLRPSNLQQGLQRERGEVTKIVLGTIFAVVLSGLAVMAWAS